MAAAKWWKPKKLTEAERARAQAAMHANPTRRERRRRAKLTRQEQRRGTKLAGALFALLALLPLAACSLNKEYVAADRDTYEAIAPAHEAYTNTDPALDDDAKARRLRLLESWKLRIEAAEGKDN